MFRQSKVEAAIAWRELERMEGWAGTWEDEPLTHWHALLRRGCAAEDILDAAADYLCRTPWGDVPSLGDWLAGFESHWLARFDDSIDVAPPAIEHRHQGPRPALVEVMQ
jgi:hypothetical protein